jgi:hypothetical protein
VNPKNSLELMTIPAVHSDCIVHTGETVDKTNCYANTSVVLHGEEILYALSRDCVLKITYWLLLWCQ